MSGTFVSGPHNSKSDCLRNIAELDFRLASLQPLPVIIEPVTIRCEQQSSKEKTSDMLYKGIATRAFGL